MDFYLTTSSSTFPCFRTTGYLYKISRVFCSQQRDQGAHVDVTQLEITTELALVITKLPGRKKYSIHYIGLFWPGLVWIGPI